MNRLDDYGEILTVREVAKVLGIARNSVYQAAATGQIPSVRVGRRILFARRSLELWLSSGAEDASLSWNQMRGTRGIPSRPAASRSNERLSQSRLRRAGRRHAPLHRPNNRF